MSKFARTMLTVIIATTLALVASPSAVSAKPLPMPLMNSNFNRIDLRIRASALRTLVDREVEERDLNISHLVGDIGVLNTYYQQAHKHAQAMKKLSSQSSIDPNDAEYQRKCAAEASAFHTSLLGFRTLLDQMGREKGLANYNRDDQLQTLLKNLVNTNKDFLSSLHKTVEQVPALGPVLGPIVYEIKCILDDVLNTVENLVDGLLNEISPLLRGVISLASTTTCKSGLQVVGLCLLG